MIGGGLHGETGLIGCVEDLSIDGVEKVSSMTNKIKIMIANPASLLIPVSMTKKLILELCQQNTNMTDLYSEDYQL